MKSAILKMLCPILIDSIRKKKIFTVCQKKAYHFAFYCHVVHYQSLQYLKHFFYINLLLSFMNFLCSCKEKKYKMEKKPETCSSFDYLKTVLKGKEAAFT